MEVAIGDERVDVGLAVKTGRGPLCVPDYTKPAPSGAGWQYSQALAAILTQYKVPQVLGVVRLVTMTARAAMPSTEQLPGRLWPAVAGVDALPVDGRLGDVSSPKT